MASSLRQVTALIIGGGPVARIIGKHLKLGGIDDIGLLLKPQYAPLADQGFELHQLLTMKKKRLRHRYDDFKIIPDVATLERVHYDQIYICVSGPELRTGWLEQAWPHLRHSLWITFTPGVDDYEYIAKTVPERYIVMGKIGFVAYHAPLPNEDISPPGVAWWFPPYQMTTFKGHDEATTIAVARIFERAGMPTGTRSNFETDRILASAATTCFAAALEIHNWDMEAFRNDTAAIARFCVTQGEIGNAAMSKYGGDSMLNRRMRKPFWVKLILKRLDSVVPFPLKDYLTQHFHKQRRQMEQQFGDFVKLVRSTGADAPATQNLARDWARRRGSVVERSGDDLIPMGMVANTASRSVFSETGELGGEARGKAAADAAAQQAAQQGFPQQGFQQPQQGFPPQQQGFPQQGFPPQQQGFPPQQQQGFPPQQQGFPPQQQQGFPPQQQQGFPPQQQGFPPQQQGFPPQQQQGFPPQQQQGFPPQQQGYPPQQQGWPQQPPQQGWPPSDED